MHKSARKNKRIIPVFSNTGMIQNYLVLRTGAALPSAAAGLQDRFLLRRTTPSGVMSCILGRFHAVLPTLYCYVSEIESSLWQLNLLLGNWSLLLEIG